MRALYAPPVATSSWARYALGPADGTLVGADEAHGRRRPRRATTSLIHVTRLGGQAGVRADVADSSLELDVDGASLRVIEGTGGMQALGDDDKANIEQTIDEEVLKRQAITFRSTQVQLRAGGSGLERAGRPDAARQDRPARFDVTSPTAAR